MGACLTDPEVAKVTTEGETATFAYAVSAMQGWRDSMEDYCVVDLEVSQGAVCLGVLDGHGGKEVAAFAAGYLARSIAAKLSSNTAETALKDSFLAVDEALRTREVQTQLGNSLGDGTAGEEIAHEQEKGSAYQLATRIVVDTDRERVLELKQCRGFEVK